MNEDKNMNKGEDIKEKMKRDNNSNESEKGMFWTILIAIILVVAGVWVWSSGTVDAPTDPSDTSTTTDEETATTTDEEQPELGEDSTEDIQDQLEGVNLEDIEGEFDDVDQDLQELEVEGN